MQDVNLLEELNSYGKANRHSYRSLRRGKLEEIQSVARFDVNFHYG